MRSLIDGLWGEWKTVEQQIERLSDELERIATWDAACIRIQKIPGIGPVVASAIAAAIDNGAAFSKGRECSAWPGIVPKQFSTGGAGMGFPIRPETQLASAGVTSSRSAIQQ